MMFKKVFAKCGSGAKAFLIYIFNFTISKTVFSHSFAFFSGSPPEGQEEKLPFLLPNSLNSKGYQDRSLLSGSNLQAERATNSITILTTYPHIRENHSII